MPQVAKTREMIALHARKGSSRVSLARRIAHPAKKEKLLKVPARQFVKFAKMGGFQLITKRNVKNVQQESMLWLVIVIAAFAKLLAVWLLVPQEPKIASTAGQALGQTLLPTPASSVNLESIRLVEVTSAPNVMLAKSQKKGPRVARRASLVLSLTQVVPSA